jgi:putative transposase
LGKNPTDRGRQGSKLHLLVDQKGIPLGIELVGANIHDSRLVSSTLKTIPIKRPVVTENFPSICALIKVMISREWKKK